MNEKKEYPRYARYKDSGVEWLGEIPEMWPLENIRAVTRLKSEKNQPDLEVLSVYRDFGVIKKKSRDDNYNVTSLDTSNYKVVKPGDLVVNKMKAWQGSMGVSDYLGLVSPAYITCEVDQSKVRPKFLHYALRSKLYIGTYSSLSYGVRVGQWDMHYEDFKRIPLSIPTLEEQSRIVKFLDQKAAAIDTAIAKKQRLIELLKEQKAILINRAVTRGLNPDVPMKDSGVEWIGEIPAHWQSFKLKYLLSSTDYGLSESSSDYGQFKYLNMGHVQEGKVQVHNTGFLENCPENLILDFNDILFNRTNSFDLVGKCGIFKGSKHDKVTFASYLVRLRVKSGNSSDWLNCLLSSKSLLNFMRSQALRSLNQANLNPNRLISISIPVPPIEEQLQIVQFLDSNLLFIDKVMEKSYNSLHVLNEYKQTLIAHAVTGKIKVS